MIAHTRVLSSLAFAYTHIHRRMLRAKSGAALVNKECLRETQQREGSNDAAGDAEVRAAV